MWVYLFLIAILASPVTFAQTQRGYADGQPSVMVDRSVLEELKDYQPPPMFGDPGTATDIRPQKISPPVAQTLTEPLIEKPVAPQPAKVVSPAAETLLNHPTQNNRVLTERKSAPLKVTPKVTPKEVPKSKEKPQESKKPDTKQDVVKAKDVSRTNAYKPKASPTMPAVPPIHVEKDVLPALPPTTPDDKTAVSTPSIGERMMDAALMRQMESDDTKIKEKLATQPIPQSKNTPPKVTVKSSPSSTENKSLVFQAGKTDVTDAMKDTIQKNILPHLSEDTKSRIQILSFSTSPDKTESSARRISLSRALNVRDYLKEMKVDLTRIDVRALASDNSVPPDRIDIVLTK